MLPNFEHFREKVQNLLIQGFILVASITKYEKYSSRWTRSPDLSHQDSCLAALLGGRSLEGKLPYAIGSLLGAPGIATRTILTHPIAHQ